MSPDLRCIARQSAPHAWGSSTDRHAGGYSLSKSPGIEWVLESNQSGLSPEVDRALSRSENHATLPEEADNLTARHDLYGGKQGVAFLLRSRGADQQGTPTVSRAVALVDRDRRRAGRDTGHAHQRPAVG